MPTTTEIDQRHAVYYESMLGAIFEMYKFSGIVGAGLFDLYRDNILKAWSWALFNSGRNSDAARLSILFPRDRTELLNLRIDPAELITRLQRSLESARQQGQKQIWGRLYRELGEVYSVNGDIEESLICFTHSAVICREASDKEGEALALNSKGQANTTVRNYALATEDLEESLIIFREVGNSNGEADALSGLGEVQLRLGFIQQSVITYEQSLDIYRKIDDYRGEATALAGLGNARLALNQINEAAELFAAALVLFRQLNDSHGEAQVLSSMTATGGLSDVQGTR